jgi:hypothetical protein
MWNRSQTVAGRARSINDAFFIRPGATYNEREARIQFARETMGSAPSRRKSADPKANGTPTLSRCNSAAPRRFELSGPYRQRLCAGCKIGGN